MARHISTFNVETFRGIKNLELKDLADINIFVGANNCGKTSVLESLMLLGKPNDFSNVISIARLRETYRPIPRMSSSFFDSFLYLFNKLQETLFISVSGTGIHGKVFLKLEGTITKMLIDLDELMRNSPYVKNLQANDLIHENEEVDTFIGEIQWESGNIPLFPIKQPISFNRYSRFMRRDKNETYLNMTFISAIDHIVKNTFRNIVRSKNLKRQVVEILKLFDANIIDLISIEDEHGRVNQMIDNIILGYMPLSTYGDGIKKVLALASGIVEAKNGALLVDEIETSIHTSALKDVYSWLIKACQEYNVQLFLTTHSLEAVDTMLSCNKNDDNDLIRVITLVKKENRTVARILSGEKALQVRDDYSMELR